MYKTFLTVLGFLFLLSQTQANDLCTSFDTANQFPPIKKGMSFEEYSDSVLKKIDEVNTQIIAKLKKKYKDENGLTEIPPQVSKEIEASVYFAAFVNSDSFLEKAISASMDNISKTPTNFSDFIKSFSKEDLLKFEERLFHYMKIELDNVILNFEKDKLHDFKKYWDIKNKWQAKSYALYLENTKHKLKNYEDGIITLIDQNIKMRSIENAKEIENSLARRLSLKPYHLLENVYKKYKGKIDKTKLANNEEYVSSLKFNAFLFWLKKHHLNLRLVELMNYYGPTYTVAGTSLFGIVKIFTYLYDTLLISGTSQATSILVATAVSGAALVPARFITLLVQDTKFNISGFLEGKGEPLFKAEEKFALLNHPVHKDYILKPFDPQSGKNINNIYFDTDIFDILTLAQLKKLNDYVLKGAPTPTFVSRLHRDSIVASRYNQYSNFAEKLKKRIEELEKITFED